MLRAYSLIRICAWVEVEQLLAFIRLYYKRSTKVSGEQMVDERRQRGNDQENKWRCPFQIEVTLFYHPPSFNFFSIIFYHLPSSISLISFSSSVEHQFLVSILIFSSFYHTLSLSSLINTRRSFSLSLPFLHNYRFTLFIIIFYPLIYPCIY